MPCLGLSLPSAHGVIMNASHYHSSHRPYIVCLVAFKIECTYSFLMFSNSLLLLLLKSLALVCWHTILFYAIGFVFSENEHTALEQFEGGPCAVIAPVQVKFTLIVFVLRLQSHLTYWMPHAFVPPPDAQLQEKPKILLQIIQQLSQYTISELPYLSML